MFNSYNDAHYMNDSYVFYATSTNTFSNPAFVASNEEDEKSCYDFRARKNQLVQEQQQKMPHGKMSASTTAKTKQRLIDFCDNFAFTVRGKVFIMETNFKRRLRGLRRFLNERVLPTRGGRWFVAPPRQPPGHCSSADHQPHMSASSSLRDLVSNERNARRLGAPGQFFISQEPISTKALGQQQERILTRLERIKRDSQRLFNMQHATIMESKDNETVVGEQVDADSSRESLAELASASCRFQVPVWLARSKASPTPLGGEACDCSKPNQPKPATADRARWPAIARGNKQIRQVAAAACSLSNPKKTCIVCYERTPNIVTLPCEHSDICSDCFIEIIYMAVKNSQYPLRCVLCRQKIERIRCSRRLMLSVIKRNRKSSNKSGSWTKSSKVKSGLLA